MGPLVLALALAGTSTLTASRTELYRLAAEATAQAEIERSHRLECLEDLEATRRDRDEFRLEAARLRVSLASASVPRLEARDASWVWPVAGAALGASTGLVAGERLAEAPGALVGATLGALLLSALGVLISGL